MNSVDLESRILEVFARAHIRRGGFDDIAFIVARETSDRGSKTISAYTADQHARLMVSRDALYGMFECSGRPVGYVLLCGLESAHRSLEVRRIFIEPQGTGMGRRFLALLRDTLVARGLFERLWLDVFEDNLPARQIYTDLGFLPEGRLRNAAIRAGRSIDLILMSVTPEDLEADVRGAPNSCGSPVGVGAR
jgi:diamine N-acetyltransferase